MMLQMVHLNSGFQYRHPSFFSATTRSTKVHSNTSSGLIRRPNLVLESKCRRRRQSSQPFISSSLQPLDLTEDNINQVLIDARDKFPQIFDSSVNITGEVKLAELDGPFVKISLKGRFWHTRSTVLARIGNYLKQRIPEIMEVEIEDEKQLDDSPQNF